MIFNSLLRNRFVRLYAEKFILPSNTVYSFFWQVKNCRQSNGCVCGWFCNLCSAVFVVVGQIGGGQTENDKRKQKFGKNFFFSIIKIVKYGGPHGHGGEINWFNSIQKYFAEANRHFSFRLHESQKIFVDWTIIELNRIVRHRLFIRLSNPPQPLTNICCVCQWLPSINPFRLACVFGWTNKLWTQEKIRSTKCLWTEKKLLPLTVPSFGS